MPFFKRNDNILIFYLDEGPQEAQAVLLIPGITYPRGQGRSSAPAPTPDINAYPGPDADPSIIDYYPQTAAQDFIALLQDLNIKSVILIAHSLGTAIAYHLASVRPDLTRAMVILDPLHSVPAATADEYLTDPTKVLQNLAMLFGPDLYPSTVPAWHNTWIGRRAAQGDMGAILAQCSACLGDPQGIGRREVSVAQHDEKIQCPRLTLGNSEFWVSTERSHLSPSTELDDVGLVEDSGHWFFQLKSEEVNERLNKWFVKIGVLSDC